jgi:hypothetical protein
MPRYTGPTNTVFNENFTRDRSGLDPRLFDTSIDPTFDPNSFYDHQPGNYFVQENPGYWSQVNRNDPRYDPGSGTFNPGSGGLGGMGGFLGSGLDWHNDIAPGLAFVGSTIGGAALGTGLGEAGGAAGEAGGAAGSSAGYVPGAEDVLAGGVAAGGSGGGGAGGSIGSGVLEGGGMSAGGGAGVGATEIGGGATGAAGGSGTALSRILDGTATTADWLSVGGNLGATGLGVLGSRNQANAYNNLASQYTAFGAPSRSRYEASMTPGFDPMSIPGYSGAVDTASRGILARLAASGGNPWGNPGGLIEANRQIISGTALPAIQQYQNQNAATGGYGAFNTAAPAAASAAIGARGNVYNAVGGGLAGLLNPQPSLIDTLRALNVQGLS